MISFLPPHIKAKTPEETQLLQLLNQKANEFYEVSKSWDIDALNLDEETLYYFKSKHIDRFQFAISTTILSLFNSLLEFKKDWSQIAYLEYGGGIGIPHLFVSYLGLKVYYNDYLENICTLNEHICKSLGFKIEASISGTSEEVKNYFINQGLTLDIFVSRNVIEHIPDFEAHAKSISEIPFETKLIIIETTTANPDSLLARIQHYFLHESYENQLGINERIKFIQHHFPQLEGRQVEAFAKQTRGLAHIELQNAIHSLLNQTPIVRKFKDSNVCEPVYGVWSERLMPSSYFQKEYEKNGFQFSSYSGFWEVDSKSLLKRLVGGFFNRILYLRYPKGTGFGAYIVFKNTKN